jgi:BASS family bile acid:Na+ symporter
MDRALKVWTDGFVLWVLVFSAVAYFRPGWFLPLRDFITPALGLVMLGMGATLLPEDFVRVLRMKRAVACGVSAQFVVMPLLAFLLAKSFDLDDELAMGVIIVGSCPGGTASNVIVYLAKADVPLSVTMTACSTLLAVVATPLLVKAFGGTYLPVDAGDLFASVATIVIIPVIAGLVLRHLLQDRLRKALDVFPAFSVLIIVLIIATIVAASNESLPQVFNIVGVVVVLHNLLGLALGYAAAAALRLPRDARRTIAIEVGMQNSGLGVALANRHFASTVVALPAALFSVVHNLSGSLIAAYWARVQPRDPAGKVQEDGAV